MTRPCTFIHGSTAFEQALAALSQFPAPEIVLLDVGMPGIDGLGATKNAAPNVQILIFPAFENDDKLPLPYALELGLSLKILYIRRDRHRRGQGATPRFPMTRRVAPNVLEAVVKANPP